MTAFNPKFLFYATILLCFVVLMGYTHFQAESAKEIDKQYKEKLAKEKAEMDKILTIITPTPEPTHTPYILETYQPIKIDNRLDINQWYNFKSNNASGYKQLNVSARTYGYKTLDHFTYYDYKWGKNFNMDAPNDSQFLFVYFDIVMDMDITGGDVRMYLPQQDNFKLQVDDILYSPIVFDYEHNQIREMESVYDSQNAIIIKPYAYEYVNIADNKSNTKKPVMMKKIVLYGGVSNSESGYLVFNVPENINLRMTALNADFWSFGKASWRLHNG